MSLSDLEPIVAPPQKFYQQYAMTQVLYAKKFKEFETAPFEIFRIKVFNRFFVVLN